MTQPFAHRSYLGWIRDLATEPRPNSNWPAIDIDAGLLRDYDDTFAWMQRVGLNEIVLWGLFTDRNWSLDVEQTISAERASQVRDLLFRAKSRDIRVLCGLGLYSWGFETIIAAHPQLGRGNARVMSPAVPEAWEWQKRVLDYIFTFPFDGVSMQSADLGRNADPELAHLSDLQYHALVNDRAASYVKETYAGKLVGVSGWGMNFGSRDDLPAIRDLTRHLDYLADVEETARAWQDELIPAIAPCAYGSTASPNVEPPTHWARDRYFLPIIKRASLRLQQLHARGGRAMEAYMRLRANPGDEASIEVVARLLSQPETPFQDVARESLNDLYKPRDGAASQALLSLFLDAEDAYFEHARTGETELVRLEPLESDHVGPPVYLQERMNADQLDAYASILRDLQTRARQLEAQVENAEKMRLVALCLENALKDVATAHDGK